MEELHDFPSSRIGTSKSSQSFRTPGEEHVRVVVRIRPPLSREIEYFENETINCLEDKRSFQVRQAKNK
ncbi:hypothetical protein HMI54_001814 [Coelomomyces lativittatus]|nr:hypothetical protein HMI54_001814 [Coelomomyces lativittatus]